ncbi:MAG TPA: hypothetical protein DCE41_16625 [Cytophagales bacterium]|nr:hypothetical protein [Cytophagales bacterium]HAP63946.1 hypothetical protein [Cytophagales bacterium]
MSSTSLLWGQNQVLVDSLQELLQGELTDTTRIKALNRLARTYRSNDSTLTATYAREALSLSNQIGYVPGMADAYYHLARSFRENGYLRNAIDHNTIARSLFEKANLDKKRAYTCTQLGLIHQGQGTLNQAFRYFQESLEIGRELENEVIEATALSNLGATHAHSGEYEKARQLYEEALGIRKTRGDSSAIATLYNNLGNAYKNQGNYPKALTYYLDALNLRQIQQESSGVSTVFINLSTIYLRQGDYDQALEYLQKALAIREELNEQSGLAIVFNNIGEIRRLQGSLQEALEYFQYALITRQDIGDQRGIAACYLNIGTTQSMLEDFGSAKSTLSNADFLAREVGDQELICKIQIELGKVYYLQQMYPMALQKLMEGMDISKQLGLKDKTQDAAEYLALTYQQLGRYQEAYEAHRLFKAMTDSLLNETKTQQLTEIQMRHLFEQELDSIAIEDAKRTSELEGQVARQRAIQLGTIIVLLMSVGFVLILLRLYRSNQKTNEQLLESNEEIQSNNEEIRSVNESLQHSMETVQKQWDEITSSILYAQRIQQAILPPEGILRSLLSEHFVFFRPRNVVSGDVYWVSDRRHLNGKVFIAAVDCTGHGVPGAFMSLIANDLLNNLINERQIEDPGEILDQLHLEIRQSLNQDTTFTQDGMDIALVSIDVGKKVLAFSGANLPLVYLQDGQMHKLKGNPASIGGVRGELNPTYATHQLFYAGGLTFYLYSDGFQDQFGGPKGKKFMAGKFRELLSQIHELPLTNQKHVLEATLDEWMDDQEQVDDIMVLGIRLV